MENIFRFLDTSLRDSGISISSPLEASTPLNLESDVQLKRKSMEPNVGNSSKRQKSFSFNDNRVETEIDSTLLELRSRKLDLENFRDKLERTEEDSLGIGNGDGELISRKLVQVEEESTQNSHLTANDCRGEDRVIIADREAAAGRKCIQNAPVKDIKLSDASVANVFDSDDISMTEEQMSYTDTFDLEEDMDTDLDEEDVAIFHEFNKDTEKSEDDEKIIATSKQEMSEAAGSDGSNTSVNTEQERELEPGQTRKYLCLSEEKLLAFKRKQVLKKIRKLPISERFILHGRNLLPWNQKVVKG